MGILYAAIHSTLLTMARTCPRCRRQQVVSAELALRDATCKYCGATIPPRGKEE